MNLRSTPNPTNPPDTASSGAAHSASATNSADKTDAGRASASSDTGSGGDTASSSGTPTDGATGMSGNTGSGAAVSTDSMVQEFLAEQAAGQTMLVPPREPPGKRIATLIGQHHGLLLVLTTVLLWAAMTLRPPGEGTAYQRGAIAPHDIVAPHGVTVLDSELTETRKQEAAALVPPEYEGKPTAQARALMDLNAVVAAAQREFAPQSISPRSDATGGQANGGVPTPAQIRRFNARLQETSSPMLPPQVAAQVLEVPASRWSAVKSAAERAVRAAYTYEGQAQQIRSDVSEDLAAAQRRMARVLESRDIEQKLSPEEIQTAFALARQVVRYPNLVVDSRKTEREKQEARNKVPAVYRNILPGTVLVEAGAVIDKEKWEQLRDVDLVAPRFNPWLAGAHLALCIVIVAFSAGYIARFYPRLVTQPASLWLVAIVPITFIALFRLLLRVPHGDYGMVPLAATAAMLLTILLDARVGVLGAFIVAALCAVMARADSALLLATALAACVGVLSIADITSRGHLLRAAALLAVTNAFLIAAVGMLRESPGEEMISTAIWAAVSGLVSVVATAGLAMLLERPFGITTHLRLLELSAPDEVVMRRMQAEAPGTYTHSLMVAMLGEAAAKAVGADPLLCRVGGLYHDIGKLRRPHCFIENQSGDNVHDRLSPQLSAVLIISHVKDGLELGRALRLPQPVLDIIAQHHGTTLLAYFYHRARQQAKEEAGKENLTCPVIPTGAVAQSDVSTGAVSRSDTALHKTAGKAAETNISPAVEEALFHYAGPRPQSKEAAIVLLADTIEASSRALPNLTPERLEEHIKTMMAQRLQEGELADCELTLRDIETIRSSFAHVLRGVLHHRIEYPEQERELKDGRPDTARDWMQDALADPSSHVPERRAYGRPDRRQESLRLARLHAHDRATKLQNARDLTVSALSAYLHGNDNSSQPGSEAQRTLDAPRTLDVQHVPEAASRQYDMDSGGAAAAVERDNLARGDIRSPRSASNDRRNGGARYDEFPTRRLESGGESRGKGMSAPHTAEKPGFVPAHDD